MQVKWIQKSVDLVEEQFDQKVSMALCMAVDKISKTEAKSDLKVSCSVQGSSGKQCCSNDLSKFIANEEVKEVVDEALVFYNIDMPFEMEVSEYGNLLMNSSSNAPSYSCSLNPLIDNESHKLDISFPGKKAYIFDKMWLMTLSSIFLLLFITGIVIYANYVLIKQVRIRKRNKEFFNHMAHEFKTPLTNIGLASSLLSKKSDDRLIDIISKENEQLSEQVDRVLTMASMENGQFELKKESIDLSRLIVDILDQMQIQIVEKNAQIDTSDFSQETMIFGDKFHLTNAIRNILDNALKYSGEKPIISIKVVKSEDEIKIQIADNGIGISNADQKMLFEKFYRIKDNMESSKKGFGLGLSYVKKIMDLHRGSIAVFSDLHSGSRFDLIIPQTN